jgi:glycosyltransferase involved in cell wall biosynthesis
MAARLMPYKRLDVGVRAFQELDLPLKVVGTGRDLKNLQKMAGPKTEFLGFVPDDELRMLFGRCRAFVQTGAEDFGITQIEAMAGGAPVIAIKQNGPAEVNIEGVTGVLFDEQNPDSLVKAVRRFEANRTQYDSRTIRQHAESYSREVFMKRYGTYVEKCYKDFKAAQQQPKPVSRAVNESAKINRQPIQ